MNLENGCIDWTKIFEVTNGILFLTTGGEKIFLSKGGINIVSAGNTVSEIEYPADNYFSESNRSDQNKYLVTENAIGAKLSFNVYSDAKMLFSFESDYPIREIIHNTYWPETGDGLFFRFKNNDRGQNTYQEFRLNANRFFCETYPIRLITLQLVAERHKLDIIVKFSKINTREIIIALIGISTNVELFRKDLKLGKYRFRKNFFLDSISQKDIQSGRQFLVDLKNGLSCKLSEQGVVLPGHNALTKSHLEISECRINKPLTFIHSDEKNHRSVSTVASMVVGINEY